DFSFLRGASDAAALFERARRCGYSALAITDECSLAGIVRALEASESTGLPLVVGSEFVLVDGLRCVLLVEHRAGYTRLCELITIARRAAGKGRYCLARGDVERVVGACGLDAGSCGLFALWLPGDEPDPEQGRWLRQVFGERAWLAVELHRETDDAVRLSRLLALADRLRLPALASGDVHMANRRERILQDTLPAIRHTTPLAQAGGWLFRNGERHLRTRRARGNIYPPHLLQATVELARRCVFSLREVKYDYPAELVPEGQTPASHLRALTEAGMRERWPQGTPARVVAQIEEELALIAELKYEAFFLTVHDIVRYA